jgi:energy-coupling factor transporter ATP-binding protein EcfA2
MHIEKVLLRDVGPFDDVTIEFPKGTDPQLADVYLLTGPNGTGKSTILYALASVIGGSPAAGGSSVELGHSLLTTRMRSRNAVVALRTDDGQTFAVSHPGRPLEDPNHVALRDPFEHVELRFASGGEVDYWETDRGRPHYSLAMSRVRLDDTVGQSRFDWAAFAYAGVCSAAHVEVVTVQEPRRSAFENSLSFQETADASQLANWIASQNFRRLKAKEAGHAERAEQLARSVRDIETTIGQILEDPHFAFVLTDEDDDIRVRWKDVVIPLDHLPAGLMSIVGWIADLMMRLDRIPWRDNTPVLQRSFLLLLDEMDIHLHPAWQRRVLPLAQRIFPNAQIIASTHSPLVVTSVDDAHIITLGFRGRSPVVTNVASPQIGVSYTAVLRSIFGIDSEFDIDTERNLNEFHEAKRRLLSGDSSATADVDRLAELLSRRSEELREVVALELGQLQRQLARRTAP